jgi:hypothetical protein
VEYTSNSNIRTSSAWDKDAPGFRHSTGQLNGEQGWSAGANDQNQWLELDLGVAMTVVGIMTQGRRTTSIYYANAKSDQWVTKYKVSVSQDGNSWQPVDGGREFGGNNDGETHVKRMFGTPVVGRYVRIMPTAWQNHITMRAAAVVCVEGCSATTQVTFPCGIFIDVWLHAWMCFLKLFSYAFNEVWV